MGDKLKDIDESKYYELSQNNPLMVKLVSFMKDWQNLIEKLQELIDTLS